MKEIKKCAGEILGDILGMRGMLITLVAFYLFVYSPILSADFLYRDDLRRAAIGFRGWGFGRYLSLLCSVFLHQDIYLTDISPLPQILGAGVMGFASLLLVLAFWKWRGVQIQDMQEGKKGGWPWWGRMALAVLPLGIYPCFLNCICYKYDAPYMALSVLLSLLPLAFAAYGLKGRWYALVTGLCTMGMCMTYQASSGIFPMMVLLFLLFSWIGGEGLQGKLSWVLTSAGGYLGGLVLYWVFFMRNPGEYVSTSLGGEGFFLLRWVENYEKYLGRSMADTRVLWQVLMGLVVLFFFGEAIYKARGRRILAALVLLALSVPLWMLSLGAYPLLEKPLFLPRAMYGPGALLTGLALYVAWESGEGVRRKRKEAEEKEGAKAGGQEALEAAEPGEAKEAGEISRMEEMGAQEMKPSIGQSWRSWYFSGIILCLCLLNYSFMVFSFTLGNALSAQAEYTRFRVEEVLMDLSKLPVARDGKSIGVQLTGNIGYAPMIQNLPGDYEMLRRIVPSTFKGDYMWGEYGFFNYYGINARKLEVDISKEEFPELSRTRYHVIYGAKGRYYIRLL